MKHKQIFAHTNMLKVSKDFVDEKGILHSENVDTFEYQADALATIVERLMLCAQKVHVVEGLPVSWEAVKKHKDLCGISEITVQTGEFSVFFKDGVWLECGGATLVYGASIGPVKHNEIRRINRRKK
jgi:hypothetical protein